MHGLGRGGCGCQIGPEAGNRAGGQGGTQRELHNIWPAPARERALQTCSGVTLVRLDAFGYTTKKAGTNCFFVEPEVWQLLDRVKTTLSEAGTELLCEVHEHYSMQKRLSEHGLWVYDFALPLLSIQARPTLLRRPSLWDDHVW